jgi:tetratricopeptide (TPR) repeat protein
MFAMNGPHELDYADAALDAGDLATAEGIVRRILAQRPDDVSAIRMLGEIAATAGALRDAEALHRRALGLAPDFEFARLHLALTLHQQNRAGEALAEVNRITGDLAQIEKTRMLKASSLARIGEYADAIALYREIAAANPANLEAWTSLTFLLKTMGKPDEAVEACRSALKAAPTHGEAWWMLADMKTYAFTDEDIAALEQALAAPDLSNDDRLRLHFALGKALEDRKQVEPSFANYRDGNALRAVQLGHDPEHAARLVERSEQLFTPEFLAARAGAGNPAPDPIFVVGLPRSGSTLVEQILASHPQIEGTAELPDIYVLARNLEPDPRFGAPWEHYPQLLADLPPERLRELGTLYLERTRIQRKSGRPFFIDKMPNNWAHVGFIKLILPNAKIVDVRRHPLACGFSNYKQLYARGQEFSYDLGHFGQHYRTYVRLMDHFDRVAPGMVHRVIHERLVADPEQHIRRLLDYIGVPFDPACLDFHNTDRPVRTASAQQGRQPMRADKLEEWRAYDAYLDPLKDALGPLLDSWEGSPVVHG